MLPDSIPGENTLMDQDPPTGEGAGVSDLTERFFSPVDKTKNLGKPPDPVGAFNMPHGNNKDVYDFISKRQKFRNLNKI